MKVVLIGAGNLGFHLGQKLYAVGFDVLQVYSRKIANANNLADRIGAKAISSLHKISSEAELYIIAVQDNAIKEVAFQLAKFSLNDKLIVHTSGATHSDDLREAGLNRYGVFYPLQTFSKSKTPDFETIPFCLFANNISDLKLLKQIASKISNSIFEISDEQRATLHVAAVFVNNFSNHLYHVAEQLLNTKELGLDLLLPLIQETVDKIKVASPHEMQTGPAIRMDDKTIQEHLIMLENYPSYQQLYQLLTKSIQESR